MKYIVLFMFSLFTYLGVYADTCDNKTKSGLLKEANAIKIDYEEKSETVHVNENGEEFDAEKSWLEISLYNVTNNFSLQISNDYNSDKLTVVNSMVTDGKYTFKDYNYNKIIKYKIEVYNNNDCDMYLVKTINYTKPMLNPNYYYQVCEENPGVNICKKFITNSKLIYNMGIGLDEAIKENKKNSSNIDDNEEEIKKNFWQKYYIYIISCGCVLTIAGAGAWIYINKKRSEI